MFGLAGAAGLTLAFIRRLRALFWAGVGILCLIILSKQTKQGNRIARSDNIMQIEPEQICFKYAQDTDAPRTNRLTWPLFLPTI